MEYLGTLAIFGDIAACGQMLRLIQMGRRRGELIQQLAATLTPVGALEDDDEIVAADMPDKIQARIGMLAQQPGSDLYDFRSEEHTSELQSLMRISSADFCL